VNKFADADPVTPGNQASWPVNAGAEETDLLNGVEKVSDGAGHRFLLVGNGAFATSLAAINLQSGDTLVLAHSLTQPFSGVISGLADVHQQIDLKDFTFTEGHMTATTSLLENGNTSLVITNTAFPGQSASFTLAGDYTGAIWKFASDSGTGTIFYDPPAADTDALNLNGAASADLTQTVTAALTTQDETADQFTFQGDSQSGTLAVDSTLVASADPSATDAATPDTTQEPGATSPTAPLLPPTPQLALNRRRAIPRKPAR